MSAPELTNYADGVGQVTASQFNTFCQTCDNLAQLADFVGTVGMQVYVRGAVEVGDGQQGNWYWTEDVVGPTNNTTIVIPPAATSGGWIRLDYLPFLSMFLPKTTEVPGVNVSGGFLYVNSTGALVYRGPITSTTLAPP